MLEEIEKFSSELAATIRGVTLGRNVPWRVRTTLGVGGDIPLLAEPVDDLALARLLEFCRAREVKTMIIGGGANIAGCDEPFDGVVIAMTGAAFTRISAGRNHISCGAGVRLSELAQFAASHGYGGLIALAGIPGTVGGALAMNAGAEGHEICEFVAELAGVTIDGVTWSARKCELDWGYRTGGAPSGVILTAAIFELPQLSPPDARRELEDFLEARRKREPRGRSAGCSFRNPGGESAGRLIDRAGMKLVSVGGAAVSGKHANFVLNAKNASERDFVSLLTLIRKQVAETSGYYLRPEVVFANEKSRELVMNAVKSPKVLVLCGGDSSEREVSLRSGQAVAAALVSAGYDVEVEDIRKCEITPAIERADVIFPALHGGFGENGELQRMLEAAGKKFVGCGAEASRIVMDKILSKQVMEKCGISTSKWAVVTPEQRDFPAGMNFPVVVKAPRQGSSVGVEKVASSAEWNAALDRVLAYDREILVEEFVEGVEISVPVVNGTVLPAVEIRSPHGFYDYDAKYVYTAGHTEYFCPVVSLSRQALDKAADYTARFYKGVDARQMLRVDFIVRDGEPFALEGNSLPGFTATSLVPKSAKVFGWSFEKLCVELVVSALRD
ncbi:MAG: D-alanine--D-alanine ligase [Victivallaceae bacterium]|nr:D-alanine--D-alanine ligase [Victivallaceae bacterium]